MDNRYGLMRQSSGVWRSLRDGDFEEEDVWSILKDRTINDHQSLGDKPCLSVPRRVPTAARMIPKASRGGCDSGSSSVNSSHEAKIVQQSAPVNIPNWPTKIYRQKSNNKDSENNASWHDHDADYDHDVGEGYDEDDDDDGGDDDDDDDDGGFCADEYDCKVPPHEFIARRLAKSHISTFSVFEGVGRTLKGRDLSKVRNAILTKTGFLESL